MYAFCQLIGIEICSFLYICFRMFYQYLLISICNLYGLEDLIFYLKNKTPHLHSLPGGERKSRFALSAKRGIINSPSPSLTKRGDNFVVPETG